VVRREGISNVRFHAPRQSWSPQDLGAASAELVAYTDSGEVTGDMKEVWRMRDW